MLGGLNVVMGVTGSIAAVRTVELAHELRRHGASVRAVLSPDAQSIIHPWSLEYATGNTVITEITGGVEHVDLCGYDGWADVFLIAPATANTIGKLAASIDDTPITTCGTTAIGAGLPTVVAPAMHQPMYDHPGVLESLDTLESWGIHTVDPRHEEGKAKIAADETIVTEVARATGPTELSDRHIVVTSGATSEPIDPVRLITNRSSGKMGRAIARACYVRGADVTVIHDGQELPYAAVMTVESAEDMRESALAAVEQADAFISAAAIGDFSVATRTDKLDSGTSVSLDLQPTPKILDAVREAAPDLPIVGFKAESGDDEEAMIDAAHDLRRRIDAAFVVANSARVMGSDETGVVLVGETESESMTGSKSEVAERIVDRLSTALGD